MDYNTLLDFATDLGYELAMSGAETFRVEESISRVLAAYGVQAEVFAIPNCLIVSIETEYGKPMTRMRRIGHHGNDLDTVEKFSGLSRRICTLRPEPKEAVAMLQQVRDSRRSYRRRISLVGDFLGAFGFCMSFGGGLRDCLCAGVCGLLVGLVTMFLDDMKANQFFRTIAASFLMAFAAYGMGAAGLSPSPDSVIIGALMILVPGLLFTNAMRDIIYGDTNSGVNRIVQVLLVAAALALGTAAAWHSAAFLWGVPVSAAAVSYGLIVQAAACFVGCMGFVVLFNIHGPGGLLCGLGGVITCLIYLLVVQYSGNDLAGYFWASVFAASYSEIMARIRKYPAISYLVVSIFPLIPGAGVYYTMEHAVRGRMEEFASRGMHTAAVAGIVAVGLLLISTSVRLWTVWKSQKR